MVHPKTDNSITKLSLDQICNNAIESAKEQFPKVIKKIKSKK